MKHQIPFFDDCRTEAWAVVWILMFVATVVSVPILGGLTVPWLYTPLLVLPWGLYSYGIFGHVLFNADEKQIKVWKRYKALGKEYRKAVGMDAKEFAALTSNQYIELTNRISQLEQAIENRDRSRGLPDSLRTRIDTIIEQEKEALAHDQRVRNELAERGWA